MRRSTRLLVLAILTIGALAVGCASARPARTVSLHRIAPPGTVPADANPVTRPLRIAAASIISPRETIRNYGGLFAYLEGKVGRPTELIQRRSYQETYDLLRYGSLDLALVCTYVYVLGQDEVGLDILAAPAVNGRAEYRSYIITRADSGLQTLDDLAGKRFAFTDPLSTSGRLYPLSLLAERNLDPGQYFGSTLYTYSHDNSIKAVVQALADGAAVDSLVYEQWVRMNPALGAELQIIQRSMSLPSPPIVARRSLDPALREELRRVLLDMHLDPKGQKILAALGVDRFVPQQDADYEPIRAMARTVGLRP